MKPKKTGTSKISGPMQKIFDEGFYKLPELQKPASDYSLTVKGMETFIRSHIMEITPSPRPVSDTS